MKWSGRYRCSCGVIGYRGVVNKYTPGRKKTDIIPYQCSGCDREATRVVKKYKLCSTCGR